VQNPSNANTLPQPVGLPALQSAVNPAVRVRVEVLTQIGKAERLWRELVQQGAICSRYQHYSWMAGWWDHIGSISKASPHVTVLRDDTGKPVLLLPLVRKQVGPLQVGFFMGGKHTNFNLPVWCPEHLNEPAAGLNALLKGLPHNGPRLDLLVLLNQPFAWQGVANPMLYASHEASASRAYAGELQRDFEALLKERMGANSRKKLRQKERQLAALGPVTFQRARTPAEIDRVLAAFFQQKAARMCEQGLSNAFDVEGVKEFTRAAAHEIDPDTSEPVIELYVLSVRDTIIATFGGIVAGGRFSGMFNSIAGAEFRNYSPGELLLANVIRMCCERGLGRFDLGIGDAAYKQVYCKDAEALYDSVIPITAAGQVAAPIWRAGLTLKGKIKKSGMPLRAVRSIRQVVSRRAAHE
jgi:CelD/BcsL family acetyltransferase involved in cellulose biosynthesis